ncbi:MAG: DUF4331 family protein [Myxococcota bacterium]
MKRYRVLFGALAAAALVPCVSLAADHAEAPIAGADPAADISDFYAWHTGDQIVAAIGFAGLTAAGGAATYDADVLYTIHIDNNADNIADIDVLIRFGQDSDGGWGVQVQNLPGASGDIEGAVEATLDDNGAQVFAGLRDDPFFFDLDGYLETLSTGTLSFDANRDSFATTNITAIVVSMDADAASAGNDSIQIWTTTARK